MKTFWRKLLITLLVPSLMSCSKEKDIAPTTGAIAPDFTLTNLEGSPVRLNDPNTPVDASCINSLEFIFTTE